MPALRKLNESHREDLISINQIFYKGTKGRKKKRDHQYTDIDQKFSTTIIEEALVTLKKFEANKNDATKKLCEPIFISLRILLHLKLLTELFLKKKLLKKASYFKKLLLKLKRFFRKQFISNTMSNAFSHIIRNISYMLSLPDDDAGIQLSIIVTYVVHELCRKNEIKTTA